MLEGLSCCALGDLALEELPALGSYRGCPHHETPAAPVFILLPRGGICQPCRVRFPRCNNEALSKHWVRAITGAFVFTLGRGQEGSRINFGWSVAMHGFSLCI